MDRRFWIQDKLRVTNVMNFSNAKELGMVSNKMSIITIFGHKQCFYLVRIPSIILLFFTKKLPTAFNVAAYI